MPSTKLPRPSGTAPDEADALLSLCREISACQETLSRCAAEARTRLQAGVDADKMNPAFQQHAEGADRLWTLVETLGKRLREKPVASARREEVRQAVEEVKVRLARLADQTGDTYAVASRKGVRIPGVGGRPYARKRP